MCLSTASCTPSSGGRRRVRTCPAERRASLLLPRLRRVHHSRPLSLHVLQLHSALCSRGRCVEHSATHGGVDVALHSVHGVLPGRILVLNVRVPHSTSLLTELVQAPLLTTSMRIFASLISALRDISLREECFWPPRAFFSVPSNPLSASQHHERYDLLHDVHVPKILPVQFGKDMIQGDSRQKFVREVCGLVPSRKDSRRRSACSEYFFAIIFFTVMLRCRGAAQYGSALASIFRNFFFFFKCETLF